ncbi:MAG: hypothetical protein RLZZ301_1812 [Bacteroidota bacterium]
MRMRLILLLFGFVAIQAQAQALNALGQYNFFGFQLRAIAPMSQMQSGTQQFSDSILTSTIRPASGYIFGATVRYGLTNLIALETGLHYSQRYFQLHTTRTDIDLSVDQSLRFVQFEIPIQALIYIQLNKKLYANAALGTNLLYKPSSVAVYSNPSDKHEFRQIGLVDINEKLAFDLMASEGFEWRDKKQGIFYLGASANVNLQPAFIYMSKYQYVNFKQLAAGEVNASHFSIDFKYFIPYVRSGNLIYDKGPIE